MRITLSTSMPPIAAATRASIMVIIAEAERSGHRRVRQTGPMR
jgi:hypothetical protein